MLKIDLQCHQFVDKNLYLETKNREGDITALFTKNIQDNGTYICGSTFFDNVTVCIQLPIAPMKNIIDIKPAISHREKIYKPIAKIDPKALKSEEEFRNVKLLKLKTNLVVGYLVIDNLLLHSQNINSDFNLEKLVTSLQHQHIIYIQTSIQRSLYVRLMSISS